MTAAADIHGLIDALLAGNVEYIVVGGVAAVMQGAPIVTFDLDIVHRRTPENVARLKSVLDGLGAIYRHQHGRRFAAREDILLEQGHNLFSTDLGPLDALGALDGLDFDALLSVSVVVDYRGQALRALGLETLIEIKRTLRRPKDLRVLADLEATLARQRTRG